MLKQADEMVKTINILNARLDIMQYIRTFPGGSAQMLWKSEAYMQDICRVIMTAALDKRVDPKFDDFQIFDAFRVSFAKTRRDFRLAVVDKKSNQHGFLVVTHKKAVKEALFKAMEDMRFLCRAKNVDQFYTFATNLYEWQIIYYDRRKDLAKDDDFFQLSQIFKLFNEQSNYSYGDNDLKMLISLIRCVTLKTHSDMQKDLKQLILGYNCIDNCDEIF